MSIEKALKIAQQAHKGQKDKGGRDYILHPLAVAEMVDTDEAKTVALLHDVIEDSEYTAMDLKEQGFQDDVIEAVSILTKAEELPYSEYLERVKSNPLACKVKIADLTHNSDLTRLNEITEDDLKRCDKYKKALEYLSS